MNYSEELQNKAISNQSTQTNNTCPDCLKALRTQRNIRPGGVQIWRKIANHLSALVY